MVVVSIWEGLTRGSLRAGGVRLRIQEQEKAANRSAATPPSSTLGMRQIQSDPISRTGVQLRAKPFLGVDGLPLAVALAP